MENNKNDRNEESLESTFDMLLSNYQEVSEVLNMIRTGRKELDDKQSKLQGDLKVAKSEVSDLKNQLSKINEGSIVNNKYIKKIRDLNEIEKCSLCQATYISKEMTKGIYRTYNIWRDYPCKKCIDYQKKCPDKNPKVLKCFTEKWFSEFEEYIYALILSSILALIPLLAITRSILVGLAYILIYFISVFATGFHHEKATHLTSTEGLQKISKIRKKINKKQNKYKKKLEKKYGVSYEEIDNSANELKKEQILERLQEIEHNINNLNDEITENDKKLQDVRKQETEVASLIDYIESEIDDKVIPGEEKEETAEEYVVEDMPKQYRKTKKKGVGNNGK